MVGGKKDKNVAKQIQALKESLLKEFGAQLAEILGNMQLPTQIIHTGTLSQAQEDSDMPMFIPEQITSDTETELMVDERESDTDSLDKAAQALRKLKRKKNE